MLIEWGGRQFSTLRASDLERDGMSLELQCDGELVAEVFFCDRDGEFSISLFKPNLPLLLVEQLIAEARSTLIPQKGN